MSVADNFTDFMSGTSFVFRMAVDEYNSGARNWSGLLDRYWLIVEELIADPRAKQLPFMDNPLPTLGMIMIYLFWVLLIGPMYMRDRKPMDLRRVIIFYNLFQVLLSGYMFYEHLMAGWLRGYSLTCQTVDYSDSPQSRRMFNLCYVYYLSKLSEFADTVFFVLRKKQSQITDLHVYHHSLTPIEAWILTKFIAGGNATLPNVINNFVHVLMYFYYMLSAMGPRFQKYLWWKKYMTEVQIIQFIICIAHCINALVTGCPFPRFISTLLLINASIFLALFMNFYIESYKRKPRAAGGHRQAKPITETTVTTAASGVQEVMLVATEERDTARDGTTSPDTLAQRSAPAGDDINNNRPVMVVDGKQEEAQEEQQEAKKDTPTDGKLEQQQQQQQQNELDDGGESSELEIMKLESTLESKLRQRINVSKGADGAELEELRTGNASTVLLSTVAAP
ncbi:elongation of very long chain fatty acids protein 7-like isoform X2 [Anopheles aquasalis]|uniref:elongation of very long chain fatty acids protein 7-like isoform X2 n=1 Tax=Anopheles aquasalis TaxID=42839 RepID=UPI00215B3FBB|nr:elongation of very long chain fatty acids protein 7-like isoform X2 [Anopheles aquasalis]XP_050091019.1 elongation of very long chain fatty acids protein 7-like isoform X2 [Anopheles aquasalis]